MAKEPLPDESAKYSGARSHFSRRCLKWLALSLLVLVPLGLFLVIREKLSWQPRIIAHLPLARRIAISPDEHFLACTTKDGVSDVVVYDLQSGMQVKRHTFSRYVSALAFSADSRSLAVGWWLTNPVDFVSHTGVSICAPAGSCRDLELVVNDVVYGPDRPTQARFSPDGNTLWLASTDNLRAWAIATGKLKWHWREGAIPRNSSLPFQSALSDDCRLNYRNDSDSYTVLDTKTGKRLLHTKLPGLNDMELMFSADASLATYMAQDATGEFSPVVDTRSGQILWRVAGTSRITPASGVAVVSSGTAFELRDARTGKLVGKLAAPRNAIPLAFDSPQWLYSVNEKNDLFRQRIH